MRASEIFGRILVFTPLLANFPPFTPFNTGNVLGAATIASRWWHVIGRDCSGVVIVSRASCCAQCWKTFASDAGMWFVWSWCNDALRVSHPFGDLNMGLWHWTQSELLGWVGKILFKHFARHFCALTLVITGGIGHRGLWNGTLSLLPNLCR